MIHDPHDFARVRYGVQGAALLAWALLLSGHAQAGAGDGLQALLAVCSSTGPPWLQESWWALLDPRGGLPGMALGPTMILAMMAPLSLPALDKVWRSSLRRRRLRGVLLCFAAYVGVWLLAGALMELLLMLWATAAGDIKGWAPAAWGLAVAWVWQCSPLKQHSLNQCQRHPPLAVFGWRAEWDAVRLGLSHGLGCVGTCWALMMVTLLLPQGHLVGMAAVSLLIFGERLEPPQRPTWRWRNLAWPRLLWPWLQRQARLSVQSLRDRMSTWTERVRAGLDPGLRRGG